MKLTKKSQKELFGWHAGSGEIFISEGTGNSTKRFDIQFRKNEKGTFLSMGNSKAIKLTEEQIKKIGMFAVEEIKES